jgi:hypothetical protein
MTNCSANSVQHRAASSMLLRQSLDAALLGPVTVPNGGNVYSRPVPWLIATQRMKRPFDLVANPVVHAL